MVASYNFRSAFNGFNREDVVHYIEFINAKNAAQVNQLNSELEAQQQTIAMLRAKPDRGAELEAKADELAARVSQLENEIAAAEQVRSALETELAAVKQQRDAAISNHAEATRRNEDELEAYRRAERMERQAQERAEVMYQQANGILADATAKVDEASRQINDIADQVAAQLSILQNAILDSKHALNDAAATLYSIRPNINE